MSDKASLLDELRAQYESARQSKHVHNDVPGFQQVDAQMRKSFRWLEKAIAYLDELKPPIDHRFDLGHGLVFESPRLGRAYIGQHERRIVGFPVLDEINIYYEVRAAKPLTIDAGFGDAEQVERAIDEAGLQFTSKRIEDRSGVAHKSAISVPPSIPSSIS